MKKTDWEKLKNNLRAKYLDSFKKPYEQEINDAGDKKYTHDFYRNKLKNDKVGIFTEADNNTFLRLRGGTIRAKIKHLQNTDKKYTNDYNGAFELYTDSLKHQDKKEVINLIAKHEADDKFYTFLNEQDEIYNPTIISGNRPDKLKWLGKPEQFGYFFSEFAKKGFIELPTSRGEGSYAKYAKNCYELFEFKQVTNSENLERALNPEKNKLSESNKAKIIIPDIGDIS